MEQSSIQLLIQQAEKVANANNDTVSLIFLNKELTKQLQAKLGNAGIYNLGMLGEPRKINVLNIDSDNNDNHLEQERYAITLTRDEYNGLMGDDAFDELVRVTSPQQRH